MLIGLNIREFFLLHWNMKLKVLL